MRACIARHEIAERIGCDLQEGVGDAGRQCDTHGVAQATGVLDRGEVLAPGHAHGDGTSRVDEIGDPGLIDSTGCARVSVQGSDHAEQVGEVLGVAGRGHPSTDGACDLLDRLGIEQVAQGSGPEQLPEEIGVESERGGATFGEGCIAFVEESSDVAEDERLGEGRGLVGDDVDHLDPPVAHLGEQVA